MGYRISVDTGGTFTDVVVADDDGELHIAKALTTYERAFEGIAAALADVAASLGLQLAELLARTDGFTYGTTRSTNAIVERKTARTAFFTTEGFPDILLLREGGKLDPFRQMAFPPPYVPRHLTWEIRERMDSDGSAFRGLDEAAAVASIRAAVAAGCEAIGVCLLWSTVNSAHELRVGALIAEHAPGLPFTLSHQLNPIVREYRRASSTVIDASLKPVMQAFLEELERDLRAAGLAGDLFISTSFGGAWRPREVVERPIYSVGSGPSMAPVAALTYGTVELADHTVAPPTPPDLLVCDTGGTTFDVGLVSGGEVHYTSETWLGGRFTGHITGTRAVDVKSIGAGGGSIAWIDAGGLVHVGPESAGADPGPACYGRGGTQPTITDAALLLGYLDGSNFLGGRLTLDRDAAERAFAPLAQQLGMTVEEAADASLTIASENIVGAIREITISQGIDPREVAIVAGGGASGLNIVKIARELGVRQVLLPSTAGALSACGALYADVISEFAVSRYAETRSFDADDVNEALATAEAQADAFLADLSGVRTVATRKEFFVEARYRQQVWELNVALPGDRFRTRADVTAVEDAFHATHRRIFAVDEPGQYLECLVWKVRATAELAKPSVAGRPLAPDADEAPVERQPAYFRGVGHVDAARYDGALLPRGATVDGPAVIREPTTTVVVYPGSRATVTASGNYMIDTAAEAVQPLGAEKGEVTV
ncbi:hydantoinase/oxoprolinase family protein [Conexibacter sp. CPCC 206217]|uniref:hydantoinase/oxoprolinase family protein n=1 Tax=Conexibacter sp. CPCC 206217 TaxID=3064574 RepID=UPI00271FF843|nr:hydantoinase/oxoprolinase family protein [Conexibacter sp. CPCC 206217]MDO8211743.1 hydantoinase/oxoprolinase family protein [Conexibacter sp. CPCC 206217]